MLSLLVVAKSSNICLKSSVSNLFKASSGSTELLAALAILSTISCFFFSSSVAFTALFTDISFTSVFLIASSIVRLVFVSCLDALTVFSRSDWLPSFNVFTAIILAVVLPAKDLSIPPIAPFGVLSGTILFFTAIFSAFAIILFLSIVIFVSDGSLLIISGSFVEYLNLDKSLISTF